MLAFMFVKVDVVHAEEAPPGYQWKKSYVVVIDSKTGSVLKEFRSDSEDIYLPNIEGNIISIARRENKKSVIEMFDLKDFKNVSTFPNVIGTYFRIRNVDKLPWVIDDEVLYSVNAIDLETKERSISARDLKTGKTLWTTDERDNEHFGYSLHQSANSIYTIGSRKNDYDGKIEKVIFSIEKRTGKISWEHSGFLLRHRLQPVFTDNKIVLVSWDDEVPCLISINGGDGQTVVKKVLNDFLRYLRIIGDNAFLIGWGQNETRKVKEYVYPNGAVSKIELTVNTVSKFPIKKPKIRYVSESVNPIYFFSTMTGEELCRKEFESRTQEICSINDEIYLHGDKGLAKINPTTCETVWETDISNKPICSENHLFTSKHSDSGYEFSILNKDEGHVEKKYQIGEEDFDDVFEIGNVIMFVRFRKRWLNPGEYRPAYIKGFDLDSGKEIWKWNCPEGYQIINYDRAESMSEITLTIGDPMIGIE